jgi:hypothetical protein
MTARQAAVAAAAELKWMVNSAALLGRPLRYNPKEARWWGLVRLLTGALGLQLKDAAIAATQSLQATKPGPVVTAGADPSFSTSLTVDLARYESIFLANLSRALVHETPRRKGRPPSSTATKSRATAARDYGIDLGLVRSALERTPAERLSMLEANAAFVRAMRASAK